MSRTEDVQTAIWDDEDFAELTPHAKLVYLWSFTNTRCNMAGLYKVRLEVVPMETGLTANAADSALEELRERRFLGHADGVLFIRSRVRNLRNPSPNLAKAIATVLKGLRADHPQRRAFVAEYADDAETAWLHPHCDEAFEATPKGPMESLPRPSEDTPKTLARDSEDPSKGLDAESHEQAKSEDPPKTLPRDSEDSSKGPKGQGRGRAKGRATGKEEEPETSKVAQGSDSYPESFSDELVAEADQVLEILRRIAGERRAIEPTRLALGRAMELYPNRDFVRVAGELEHWLLHGVGQTKRPKDVVGYYRNQLDRSPEIARRQPKAERKRGRLSQDLAA